MTLGVGMFLVSSIKNAANDSAHTSFFPKLGNSILICSYNFRIFLNQFTLKSPFSITIFCMEGVG